MDSLLWGGCHFRYRVLTDGADPPAGRKTGCDNPLRCCFRCSFQWLQDLGTLGTASGSGGAHLDQVSAHFISVGSRQNIFRALEGISLPVLIGARQPVSFSAAFYTFYALFDQLRPNRPGGFIINKDVRMKGLPSSLESSLM